MMVPPDGSYIALHGADHHAYRAVYHRDDREGHGDPVDDPECWWSFLGECWISWSTISKIMHDLNLTLVYLIRYPIDPSKRVFILAPTYQVARRISTAFGLYDRRSWIYLRDPYFLRGFHAPDILYVTNWELSYQYNIADISNFIKSTKANMINVEHVLEWRKS